MAQQNCAQESTRLPTYFVSHGGGPWPWMASQETAYAVMKNSLEDLGAAHTPRAVLMVSAHWEEDDVTIMTSSQPPMFYDYYGFPKNTYEIVYPAPGSPDVAEEAEQLLAKAGFKVMKNRERGFDHGTFVPMAIMFPEANIPLFQVSILRSYEPAAHLAMGRALAELRDKGVLIVGSGLSFHNMRMFNPSGTIHSEEFDEWLHHSLVSLSPEQRTDAMLKWESAPSARVCHDREDHLVPLWVALGAAEGEKASRIYHESKVMGGITVSSYRFG
mmetsp:Transcript_21583/g.33530  ORF Transcript_21583/g.33530 Transcript_21583/m.33530 type:complete len:273 (-) Transcript_21583:126-944(-)